MMKQGGCGFTSRAWRWKQCNIYIWQGGKWPIAVIGQIHVTVGGLTRLPGWCMVARLYHIRDGNG